MRAGKDAGNHLQELLRHHLVVSASSSAARLPDRWDTPLPETSARVAAAL